MTPLLPSHGGSSRKSTLGWLGSTAVSALLVTAVAALAMSSSEGANSTGEMEDAMLLMVPEVPALEAMAEPSPDVAAAAPVEAADLPAEMEDTPDAPELTEAPDVPDLSTPEEILTEDIPQVESEVPAPVAEKKPEPKPEPKPEKKPEPKKERKQAEKKPEPKQQPKKEAKKASEESVGAQASRAASSAASSGGGGKAAANYGATVLKKVNRTKKRSAGARGTVVVGFKVDGNGGLASAWVASGSGSEKLDQVAIDHIRRSAPFPPPPEGAQRSFSFEFVGR